LRQAGAVVHRRSCFTYEPELSAAFFPRYALCTIPLCHLMSLMHGTQLRPLNSLINSRPLNALNWLKLASLIA
jgi:hypothetical protein